MHTCTHLSHTRAADLCGVTSPSAGHQCTASPTSGSRMMRMASHPISKAPPAATARPASRTQMTWDTFSTISLYLSCFEPMKTVISARSLTRFLLFFFCRILLNDTWHILMDVIKIHGRKQPWKKTLLDVSLMFGPEHSRGSERQAWKCINLLSWLSFHCFALLLCVQYFFLFFLNYCYFSFTLCCSTFFYSLSNVKNKRDKFRKCAFLKTTKNKIQHFILTCSLYCVCSG